MSPSPSPTARPNVVLVGSFDTKEQPLEHLRAGLAANGCSVHRVDFGTRSRRTDVETTARELAGGVDVDLDDVASLGRSGVLEAMGRAVADKLAALLDAGRLDAVLFAGGSGAATVFAASAVVLPFGVPKVLVSTIAAGDTRPYLQGTDAILFFPVVDIEGVNHLLRSVLSRAAALTASLARLERPAGSGSPDGDEPGRSVAVSMFGITTDCVAAVRRRIEARGQEVLAFHANGTGGTSLERIVRSGSCSAVIDVTTTELADLVVGGVLPADEGRLTAAADLGIAQVIVPGALDTVNFGPRESVPEHFRGRRLHQHNAHVTLMRTSVDESARLGELLATRASRSPATTVVVLPMGGLSELDRPGMPFWDPEADGSLRDALLATAVDGLKVVESSHHINDDAFAALLVDELADLTELMEHS